MAAPAEALGARDKEELKEKLAFLQREYRKTFSRLQRAEKTEKVRSHVKETVARENLWLLQAVVAEEAPAGSLSQVTPGASASNLPGSCSERDAVKTPSVTFNLEPEVFGQGGPLPENLGSECADRERQRILDSFMQPVLEKKPNRLSRSRRKGLPRVASEGIREAAHDGDKPGKEEAGLEGSQSPVFMRHSSSSSLEVDCRVAKMPLAVAAEQGSSSATPMTPQSESLQRPHGENLTPQVLGPLFGTLLEESRGLPLEHLWKEGPSAASEDPAVKDTAHGQKVSVEKGRGGEGKENPGQTLSPPESGSETGQERSLSGELPSSGRCDSNSPASAPGKRGSGGECKAESPLQEAVCPAIPTSSLQDSCTVVEGLLFPVEYYVRTTRRMSRCQQELNLAAIIQSQLGKRRRGQRASPKDRVASPAPASQGLPESGALSPPLHADQERGSGSPPAPKEDPNPGKGPSQSTAVTQGSRKGRRKGRGQPRRGAQEPSPLAGLKGNRYQVSSESEEQAGNWTHPGVEPAAPRAQMLLPPSESSSAFVKRSRGNRSGLGAPGSASLGCLGISSTLKWLPKNLTIQEFHLPAEEFNLLQSEKVKASAMKPLEVMAAGESVEHLQRVDSADPQTVEEIPGDGLLSPENNPSEFSLPLQGLHTSKLLLSPANANLEGRSSQLESQLPTPLFPVVGGTPNTQDLCDAPEQVSADPSQESSAKAVETPVCGTEEERSHMATLWPEDKGVTSSEPDQAAVSVEIRQELAAESGEHCGASVNQIAATAEDLVKGPKHCPGGGDWQLTAKLKDSVDSCSVDVSAVWWEVADFTELCIVTACEASVALWRHLDSGGWETFHTWSFAEVPVFQIVPLPGTSSLVCVALGGLEIAEIRLLFQSRNDGCLQQPLVKAGNIKAVLGLSNRRLVSSCDRAVEVLCFPDEGGGSVRQALFPPEETTLAFAAVDGADEALVGLTTANCVVVWNLRTGQLLCQMPLGYAYPAPICHQAYSDSGLLFVVLSHPHAKENESCGSPAFQVVAFNPKTARSAQVMIASLPPGLQGRYLEGDVRDASAAAVLTSGAIAVWDLLGGECTALLPQSAEGRWSLVRWSVTDKCLLAGQADGSICLYSCEARLCSGPEAAH